MIPSEQSLLSDGQKTGLKLIAGVGAAALALGFRLAPERTVANLLVDNFFFVGLSLAAAVFIAVQNLSSAGWSVVLRRIPEAMTAYLPVGAVLTAALLFGARFIYPWAGPGGAALVGPKFVYLNLWSFTARSAVYWVAWLVLTGLMLAASRREDLDGRERTRRTKAFSAVFLIVFGVTFTLCSVDWIMSLEPNWYSTIYPWYLFIGAFESGLAALAVLLVLLRKRGILSEVNDHHLHDLGKFMFAFSVFWAYLWFSQFLLIWYSNMPEETTFFVRRMTGRGWSTLFYGNLLVNFAAPFALLLQASQKKKQNVLLWAGVVLLGGHWIDLYMLVMPPVLGAAPKLGALEALSFLGLAAVYLFLFNRSFAARKPIPVGDPYLDESLHFEGV